MNSSNMNMSNSNMKMSNSTSGMNSATTEFMTKAAQGGMAEVELGKLAAQKGSSSKVKEFGEQMVTDHGEANDKPKELAARKGVTLPTQLPAPALREHDKLSRLSGVDFDREYMSNMLADHKKDVAQLSAQAKTAHDADVRAFAQATLPTVQHHLEMAKDAEAATKSASAAAK